ncbi:uncharacterized protein LOC117603116 isoform X1 [Osmia lignaria lignaria]|uniref:uncharacterized protein LOC117603116 isoform X1 n=2 Tax=Osmia lignaria lignaria TaxID=1437193 RepID=UPI00402BAA8C
MIHQYILIQCCNLEDLNGTYGEMTPYLTRQRTLLLNLQDPQLRNTISSSNTVAKPKNIANKKVNTKVNSKVINTRSTIQIRNVLSKKRNNASASLDTETIEKESKKTVKHKQLSKEGINNRVKAKKSVIHNDSNNLNRNKSKVIKRKQSTNETSKNISNLRQMSLKESFVNQSKKRVLRSSKNTKGLKNDEIPIKKDCSPKLNDCGSREKLPVYKSVPLDNSQEDTNEIYEFKFDVNDSKEKLPKKRKKKFTTKKTLLSKKKKNVFGKHNLPEIKIDKEIPTNFQFEEVQEVKELKEVTEAKRDKEAIGTNSVEILESKVSTEPVVEHVLEKDDLQEDLKNVSADPLIEHVLTENVQEYAKEETDTHKSEKPQSTKEEQVKDNITKPRIVSVEDLNNKKVTMIHNSQTSKSDDFQPFRLTDIFKSDLVVQQKNMLNHSLFERSLSPIKKSSENLEIGSPWRTPQPLTFSQVKNAFQSTPQSNKYGIFSNKFVRTSNNEIKPYGSIINAKNISQKNNENINEEGYVSNVSHKKRKPSGSRKFGTEITNINQSLQSNPGEGINELVVSEAENIPPPAIQTTNTMNLSTNNTFSSGTNENKENNMSNQQSQIVVKKERKKVNSQSPKKSTLSVQMDEQKENFDPQPGPSGLQNRSIVNDQRVLRQSNLNNFLNIMEMPQSTTIKTAHKIFDDICSTPVSTIKSGKKLHERSMELQNAFGFSDEDDENLSSSVEYKNANDKEKEEKAIQTNLENYNRPLARLSVNEIKNKLAVNKLKEDIKKVENVQTEKLDVKRSPLKEKNKNKIDITSFSDTFDVLSETGESKIGNNIPEVPLFADFEPTHFSQPPRYSYKRKRPVKFSLSDESGSEEEEIPKHEIKRKRGNKMKLQQEQRLKNWVKNINKTFSEVDQHELVVE